MVVKSGLIFRRNLFLKNPLLLCCRVGKLRGKSLKDGFDPGLGCFRILDSVLVVGDLCCRVKSVIGTLVAVLKGVSRILCPGSFSRAAKLTALLFKDSVCHDCVGGVR